MKRRSAAPETTVFQIAKLRVRRMGFYAQMLERLKELSESGEGLMVGFSNASAGSNATKRLAVMAAEDGWEIYQQLAADGRSRYVWAKKTEGQSDEE